MSADVQEELQQFFEAYLPKLCPRCGKRMKDDAAVQRHMDIAHPPFPPRDDEGGD